MKVKKILAWVWLFIVAACLYSGFSLLANLGRGVTFLEGLADMTFVISVCMVCIILVVGIIGLSAKCIEVLRK